jgi:hypothetical protein
MAEISTAKIKFENPTTHSGTVQQQWQSWMGADPLFILKPAFYANHLQVITAALNAAKSVYGLPMCSSVSCCNTGVWIHCRLLLWCVSLSLSLSLLGVEKLEGNRMF